MTAPGCLLRPVRFQPDGVLALYVPITLFATAALGNQYVAGERIMVRACGSCVAFVS